MYSEEHYIPIVKAIYIDGEPVECNEEDSDYQEFAIQVGSNSYE